MSDPFPPPGEECYTTIAGCPIADRQASQRIGDKLQGLLLLQDINLIETLSHVTHERIPERLVHAKGTGAHGIFECTRDMTDVTNADFLKAVGKQTKLFCRFSTVAGRAGSADSVRDTRGFAFKLYTNFGNLDWLFFSEPVFPIRDGGKFPSFVHCQKGRPDTGTFDPNTFWTFMNANAETYHALLMIFSDRGTPKGYEYSEIFGLNTYKFTKADGTFNYVKIHLKPKEPYSTQNLTRDEAMLLAGTSPDAFNVSLWQHIADGVAGKGAFPAWDVSMQLIPPDQAQSYHVNIFDPTKTISQTDFPLIPFGTITLNANPSNNFAEVEGVSFNPTAIVPGWNISPDPILQTRLFAYGSAARYRLGINFIQSNINKPAYSFNPTRRDGTGVNDNLGSFPNYIPGDQIKPIIQGTTVLPGHGEWVGTATYFDSTVTDDDYVQPREFWQKVLPTQPNDQQTALVTNLAAVLCKLDKQVLDDTIAILTKIAADLGSRVSQEVQKNQGHSPAAKLTNHFLL